VRWQRAGISLPRWVHGVAAFFFAVGAFISLIDVGVGAFGTLERVLLPIAFPLGVYLLFGLREWQVMSRRSLEKDNYLPR
jgi:hypothetical protein